MRLIGPGVFGIKHESLDSGGLRWDKPWVLAHHDIYMTCTASTDPDSSGGMIFSVGQFAAPPLHSRPGSGEDDHIIKDLKLGQQTERQKKS